MTASEDLRRVAMQRSQGNDTLILDDTQPAAAAPKPTDLQAHIRAYRAKAHRGTVAPTESLSTDKTKVERYLKKSGLSAADVPEGFWSEPDRDARGRMLGEIIGAAKDKERAAKRLKKMADYPVDYDKRSHEGQRRVGAAVRSRRWRAKKSAATTPTSRPTAATAITCAWRDDKWARLNVWTKGAGPLARQCRGRERELLRAAMFYQTLSEQHGRAPSHAELGAKLGCTRRAAQNRIRILTGLYSTNGPWHSKA
jgi:hypothetical protein